MYYELAKIRQYKDNKGQPYFQIRVKKGSKLTDEKEKVKPIALVNVSEIKEIAESSNINKLNELQANYKETSEELVEVKQQLQESKATVESLTSELKKLKEEKVQLQEDLLTEKDKHKELIEAANNNVTEAKDKVITLQKEHKEELSVKESEIAELNYKLNNEKDYSKALLVANKDLLKRNIFKRIVNIEPESSKYVTELKKLPENVEATDVKDISKE